MSNGMMKLSPLPRMTVIRVGCWPTNDAAVKVDAGDEAEAMPRLSVVDPGAVSICPDCSFGLWSAMMRRKCDDDNTKKIVRR